ncbi:NAD(P)-binding protein [Armillaria gallica]|uniref:NAD(P)-binding protein n=1 Tax=Armillaria gallica TaxID=47427 RepID=A0A2H3DAU4_ARMGA|nr:NAD(P)-binding protein [Armillaria gallica]
MDLINDIVLDVKIAMLQEVQAEITEKGRRCGVFPGDVWNEDVKSTVEGVVNTLGGLDVMVSNAAPKSSRCYAYSHLIDTIEQWDRTLAINTRGAFLCYQYAAKQMIKQGRGGRIIGCSSSAGKSGNDIAVWGDQIGYPGLDPGTLVLGNFGITVNAYAPGAVDTEMSRLTTLQQRNMEEVIKLSVARSAVDYVGQPEDVTGLVSYLASKEARYMTGTSTSSGRMYLTFMCWL